MKILLWRQTHTHTKRGAGGISDDDASQYGKTKSKKKQEEGTTSLNTQKKKKWERRYGKEYINSGKKSSFFAPLRWLLCTCINNA